MSQKQALFDEKAKREAPYVCGNCAHAHFKLTSQEQAFLEEMLKRYGPKMRNWTQPKITYVHGKQIIQTKNLEPDKALAADLIRKAPSYCKTSGARVFWNEINCFKHKLATTPGEQPEAADPSP